MLLLTFERPCVARMALGYRWAGPYSRGFPGSILSLAPSRVWPKTDLALDLPRCCVRAASSPAAQLTDPCVH